MRPDPASLWKDRRTGAFAAALEAYDALLKAQGLGRGAPLAARLAAFAAAGLEPADAFELLVFEPSLATREGDLEGAERGLAAIAALREQSGVPAGFEWHLQHGLNALHAGRFAEAYAAFVDATRQARLPWQKLTAELDVLLAGESLGFAQPARVERVAAALADAGDETWTSEVRTQLDGFRLRSLWRRLGTASAADLRLLEATPHGMSANYLRAWILLAPPVGMTRPELYEASCEAMLDDANSYRVARYMLRTVRVQEDEDDWSLETRHVEQIARLWLWLWLWLEKPDPVLGAKVTRLLAALAGKAPLRLDLEAAVMLRNALRWLRLLGCAPYAATTHAITSLVHPEIDAAARASALADVMRVETALLDWLDARLEGDDAARVADLEDALAREVARCTHPLGVTALARSLREGGGAGPLAELSRALTSVTAPATDDDAALVADLRADSVLVRAPDGGLERHGSHQLAEALALLAREGRVSLDRFVARVFGFQAYAERHEARTAKLLARLNHLRADLFRVQRKEAQLYCEATPGAVVVRGHHPYRAAIARDAVEQALTAAAAAPHAPKAPRGDPRSQERAVLGTLRRQDVERLASCSPTSAKRLVAGWLEAGLLRREGVGKSVVYRVVDERALLEAVEELRGGR